MTNRFYVCLALFAACFMRPSSGLSVPVIVPVPGGSIVVDVTHAGPSGQLVMAEAPENSGFRPPTIFSAPLPTGSGARALGLGGAFTAVADDATAASWNPAGLTQLETAEVSAVYRFTARQDSHQSSNSHLDAGTDRYNSSELNYASAVVPFLLSDRNAVISLNYQEAYDFTQTFSAGVQGGNQQSVLTTTNQTFFETITYSTFDSIGNAATTSRVTTAASSRIDQLMETSLMTRLDFRQRGTIDAFSPAFAVDVTPRFSVGVVLNLYTDGASRGNPIESTMVAEYEGISDSSAVVTDTRESTAEVVWGGLSDAGSPYDQDDQSVSGFSTNVSFSSEDTSIQDDVYTIEGAYREVNSTDQFYGFNATLGALWAATDRLTLGATIDLPWTGRGRQTKRVTQHESVFDTNSVLVAQNSYSDVKERDFEVTFPLYWSLGALWRWNDRFYTSVDVNCTHWSQYSYKADGEERINPLNGDSYSSSALDDCWSVHCGNEYLLMLPWTEISLRAGVFWEQRPAVGVPDEYRGISFGTGISLGEEPGRIVLDVAYVYEQGRSVMGSLLPDQRMSSDTDQHQLFVSAIWHF